MSTAINLLKTILAEGPTAPRVKLEKMNFMADYYATKFREYLSPDSESYKSVINPVFSYDFEIGAKDFISELKVFSLRDGVMPLMRFFAINPLPLTHVPLLVIDEGLSALVPPEWREKIVLRHLFVKEAEERDNKIFLFLSADVYSLPLAMLNEELEKIEKQIKPSDELFLFFSSMRMRGEGEAINDHAWGYKCLQNFLAKFDQSRIHILSFSELLKADVAKSRFYSINPLKFYFSDSFLIHDMCAKGAKPLLPLPKVESDVQLQLSFYHGFSFHQNFSNFPGEKYLQTQRDLYSQIVPYSKSRHYSDIHDKLYPKDFMDWGSDVSLALYRQSL